MGAASEIGDAESDPGGCCDVIGVNIPPMVGVRTVLGDADVGIVSSRLKRRSRLVGSARCFETVPATFFGLGTSSSSDSEDDSDEEEESELLPML